MHEFAPEAEESEEQDAVEKHRLWGGLTAVQASGRLLVRNKNRHRDGKDKGAGGGNDVEKLEEGAQPSRYVGAAVRDPLCILAGTAERG